MDLEIRTGLLESRKLNTWIEITIPRDTLLLGWGVGVDSGGSFSTSLLLLAPAHQSLGMWADAMPQPSAVIDYLTRQTVNIWGREPAWQNPLLSSTPLLSHALSLLKMCPELGNFKEGLIKGNGKITQLELSFLIYCFRPSESSCHPFSLSTCLTLYNREIHSQGKKKVSLDNLRLEA